MRLKKFRPTPSMVVAVIALVVATTGVTWAAATLPSDSVGTAQVRDNSIRSGDIRNGNVRHVDLGRNSVHGDNIPDNHLGGDDILEANLGQVPSAAAAVNADNADNAAAAANAANAERLAGRPAADYIDVDEERVLRVALRFGEKREVVTNGPIGIEAQCRENAVGNQDQVRLLGVTRAGESFLRGQDAHIGPGSNSDYLTPATLEDQRELVTYTTSAANPDAPGVNFNIDTGNIAGPGGEWIGIDAEILMLAVRVAGNDCLVVGVANLSRP